MLRVHRLGLARRDAEEVVVEGIGVADQPAGPVVDGAVVKQFGGVPPLGRDLVDAVSAVEQQLPQGGGIVCLREAAVEADDRDVGHRELLLVDDVGEFAFQERIPHRCALHLSAGGEVNSGAVDEHHAGGGNLEAARDGGLDGGGEFVAAHVAEQLGLDGLDQDQAFGVVDVDRHCAPA